MFESGIGPGVRSDRFGTWSLILFIPLFTPFLGFLVPIGFGPVFWLVALACVAVTLAAIGCGLAGVCSGRTGQRRAALHGLLKAAVPTVVGGTLFLFYLVLIYGNWE